jgi:hypothetical protein
MIGRSTPRYRVHEGIRTDVVTGVAFPIYTGISRYGQHLSDPGSSSGYDYEDVVTVNGLPHGCYYLIEAVILVSFDEEYSTGEGSSASIGFRFDPYFSRVDESLIYFEQVVHPELVPATGTRTGNWSYAPTAWTYPPTSNEGITTLRAQCFMGIPWYAPATSDLTLQVHPVLGHMIHPTTFLRATYVGAVSDAMAT